jgi:hypothetical protein
MNSTGGGITRRWSGPRRRYSFLAVERRVRRRGRSTASRYAHDVMLLGGGDLCE